MNATPGVEAKLEELFKATVDPSTKVVYGYAEHAELVAIFNSKFKREWKGLGGYQQEEKFEIEVIVEVIRRSGKDMHPAADRCWEIFDQIGTIVRADHTLTDLDFNSIFEEGSKEFFQVDKGQGCRITSTLAGTARI